MAVLVDLGIAAGALTAIVTCAVLIARLRPVRWVWRNVIGRGWRAVVSDPLAAWFREQVAHEVEPRVAPLHERLGKVEEQLGPNGGKSFFDQIMRRVANVEKAVGADE